MDNKQRINKTIDNLRRAYKSSPLGAKKEVNKTLLGVTRPERKILNKFKNRK